MPKAKSKSAAQKPANPAATSKLSPVEWKYAAFQALWTTYLHLSAWGLPQYEDLTPEDKLYFRELVKKGNDALFAHIENCKRAVLRGGLGNQIPDEWLALLGLSDFDRIKGFPQAKRDHLNKILHEMYPLLVRLDPDAVGELGSTQGKANEPAGVQGAEKLTVEGKRTLSKESKPKVAKALVEAMRVFLKEHPRTAFACKELNEGMRKAGLIKKNYRPGDISNAKRILMSEGMNLAERGYCYTPGSRRRS